MEGQDWAMRSRRPRQRDARGGGTTGAGRENEVITCAAHVQIMDGLTGRQTGGGCRR